MTEAQILALINSLAVLIPQAAALYKTVTANRAGTIPIEQLISDADTTYTANNAQLDAN